MKRGRWQPVHLMNKFKIVGFDGNAVAVAAWAVANIEKFSHDI